MSVTPLADVAMPVWLELHVDDEVLGLDSARWPEARALIVRIARLAEARDARICFRLRETFARHAKGDPILPQLAAAGHELGVHAHGRGFARAAEAVRACGVEVQVAVPGLVQVGADGREPLLRQVASLGFSLVTDHGPSQVWAYEGLASRPEAGLVVMAPTVRPTDWGLISMDGQRQGFRAECVVRLRKLEAQARAQGADYFGVAMHEHDLCPIGSLEPTPGALEALGQWLDSRVGPSRSCVPLREPRSDRSVDPLSDRRTFLVRKVRSAVGSGRGGLQTMAHQARKSRRLFRWSPTLEPGMEWVPVGRRQIVARRGGSREPRAICLMSHAGLQGGIQQGLSPFGLDELDLAREGWELWTYDRAGTGRSPVAEDASVSPGNPAHAEDWLALLTRVRERELPVVALSWSSGIIPVLTCARGGMQADALVDGEGPSDRRSIVPPRGPKAVEMGALDPWRDSNWADLEPARLLRYLQGPYARLQGVEDHVHGDMGRHAQKMWAAAMAAEIPIWPSSRLSGVLHGHPAEVLEAMSWARDRIEA